MAQRVIVALLVNSDEASVLVEALGFYRDDRLEEPTDVAHDEANDAEALREQVVAQLPEKWTDDQGYPVELLP